MAPRNQIVGLIRFSYPATDGFAVSHMPEDALLELLHDPARLAARFAYLETLALPSLAAQTDGDFTCVVLAGTALPAAWKDRLRALPDRFPFVRPVFLDRMGAYAAARKGFRRAVRPGADRVTGFRMDDDDAVAVDYVARTRDRAGRLIAAGLADAPLCLAFTRGLYLDLRTPDDPFHRVSEGQAASLACAMVTGPEMATCVYRYNHRRIAAFVPTYLEPGEADMFLRTRHGWNDSGRVTPPHATAVPTGQGAALLRDRFGLDPAAVLALMPARPAETR